jgi:hypothetical protein
MKKKTKVFKFEAWVHPKKGGDDYMITGRFEAPSMKSAKEVMKSLLKKKDSALLDDYQIKIFK